MSKATSRRRLPPPLIPAMGRRPAAAMGRRPWSHHVAAAPGPCRSANPRGPCRSSNGQAWSFTTWKIMCWLLYFVCRVAIFSSVIFLQSWLLYLVAAHVCHALYWFWTWSAFTSPFVVQIFISNYVKMVWVNWIVTGYNNENGSWSGVASI